MPVKRSMNDLNSEKCHFFSIIIIYILRTKKTNLVKRLPVQKMKHKFCNRINIALCLFSIFSKQQSVFYKHFFNVVYYLELLLAKMCLIFKVWFLVTYIIFFNSQIMTNECTQLQKVMHLKLLRIGNCFVNCDSTFSICGNKERNH